MAKYILYTPLGINFVYLTGKAYDFKVGNPIASEKGVQINGIAAGTSYLNRDGVFHALEKTGGTNDLLELPAPGGLPLIDNVLDGVARSAGDTLKGIQSLLTTPIGETLSNIKQLPTEVATLIKNSPEYAKKFAAMPLAEQQREASRLLTEVSFLASGIKGAVKAAKLAPQGVQALKEISIPQIKLNAQGKISFSSTAVDAAQADRLLANNKGAFAVLGESANRAKFQKYVDELAVGMERPHLQNRRLDRAIGEWYRENSEIGSGSTADALRFEIQTGARVGGVEHLEKVKNSITFLEEHLNFPDSFHGSNNGVNIPPALHPKQISQHDYHVLKNLHTDLTDALNTRPLPRQEIIAKLEKYVSIHLV